MASLADLLAYSQNLAKKYTSLDTPQDQTLGETLGDVALGFVPGLGTAQGGRDFERARRENDWLGMGLSAASMLPVVGGVVKAGRTATKASKIAKALEQAAPKAESTLDDVLPKLALAQRTLEQAPNQKNFDEFTRLKNLKNELSAKTTAEAKATNAPLIQEAEESGYRGLHTAPTKESGSPLHDLTNTYPEDIYGFRGAEYYGHYGQNHPQDRMSVSIMSSLRNKPNANVTIYRAVPKDPNIKGINTGDWVTINRSYAKEHGESALNGEYKILSKTVKARDIFTNGDSIHEWGYDPQPRAK